ncbi:hypothetical protein B7P43_G03647 [Cryptotermes secundus]|uniref:Uncharacterized protein n=1 Tax=Cryptotermes secundus TaxID=105785 RepID=A0A2J7QU38_9NEOP|nr:hypothetical protein B7P43_G03647 [Cryptotermes secundus]
MRIFEPKRVKIIEGWRKLHNEELYSHMVLVGKPEGMRAVGKTRHRWEDNIEISLRDVRWGGVDWINLAEDRKQRQALRVA